MPKQLISVGPSPYKTPQRIAAPSSSGTLALGYSQSADDWLFYEPSAASPHDHPYSHTSNWDETLEVALSVSGAYDLDYATARTHDLTLTGYTVITPSGALTGFATDLRVKLRQPGSGGPVTVAWSSNINWETGDIPTLQTGADAVDYIGLVSTDDGVTFDGFHGSGGGGTAATTVESETTFGISAAVGTDTEYARQDHTHGTPANPVTAAAVKALGRWEPVQYDDGNSPWPFVYYDDEIVVAWVDTP